MRVILVLSFLAVEYSALQIKLNIGQNPIALVRRAASLERGSDDESLEIAPSKESSVEWKVPIEGLSGPVWEQRHKPHLTSAKNATLPIALMVLDPTTFQTRSKAMRAIRQKHILVEKNGTENLGKADTRVFPLNVLKKQRRWKASTGYKDLNYKPARVSLPLLYEDDDMAIVNKPSGMICHSHSKGGYDNNSVLRTAPHVLKQPKESTIGALDRPSLVHRLDAPTSGCLVLAKTRRAAVNLSEQFASRKVKKVYIALLQGSLTKKYGRIDSPIDEKPAVTEWTVIRPVQSTKSPLTLVEFRPYHGRKHQLRRHASEVLKRPIAGDYLYGSTIGTKLLLCATEIQLYHPVDKDMIIRAKVELPNSFKSYIEREEARYEKHEHWLFERGGI